MDTRKEYDPKLDGKEAAAFEVAASPDSAESSRFALGDTVHDVSDMRRLGKKQEFKVKSHSLRLVVFLS